MSRVALLVATVGCLAGTAGLVGESGAGPSRALADEGSPGSYALAYTKANRTVSGERLSTPIRASDLESFDSTGSVAGAAAVRGDQVYRNEIDLVTTVYFPNRELPPPHCGGTLYQRLADDLELASGPCNLTGYSIAVAGRNECGSPTFDVHIELWNGDPCELASNVIEGTQQDINDVPNDATVKLLTATWPEDEEVLIPGMVWMAVTFSTDDSGWVVAEEAEVGVTGNTWSEDDSEDGCSEYVFTTQGQWGGFWADLYCLLPEPPLGACCDGHTCTQTLETDCLVGTWQGAFTTCEPNICLTGACCVGNEFGTCTETTEAGCTEGLFHVDVACEVDTCGPTFDVYENDFLTGKFVGISTDTKYADDLTFGPGTPCDLIAYEMVAFGQEEVAGAGAPTFDVHLELWSNNDGGTPSDPSDDLPLELIPDSESDFTGVPADQFPHPLLAGPFEGVELTDAAWIVMTTSTSTSGPGLAGMADIGSSHDGFAAFPSPNAPDEWVTNLWFGGFDPIDCPGPSCSAAGSFRVRVWCAGDPPVGACCDRMSGTCAEGVRPEECAGRWVQDGLCDDPNTFFPPCGSHACCFPFSLNPEFIICGDYTEQECVGASGTLVRGSFCGEDEVDCPAAKCFDHTDECLTPHESAGCENPFCTEMVCADDPYCCGCTLGFCEDSPQDACCCEGVDPSGVWDQTCVERALILCGTLFPNDVCEDAHRITSSGTDPLVVEFDNSEAGQDGPAHDACLSGNGEAQIAHDLWYIWESPCTDTVYVSTCLQTQIDTKMAVYDGTACPPADQDVLDCQDDLYCPRQSMVIFDAVNGRDYMIRLGTYPGEDGGPGTFTITCGPPNNASCPSGAVDCCAGENGSGLAACGDETCCEAVCACDAYCCDTEWDEFCSTTGSEFTPGCGADVLCREMCQNCPVGALSWDDPFDGVVDARRPHDPGSATPIEGIDTFTVLAPPGADFECWDLCETGPSGAANDILDVVEVAGIYTITLERPISPGELTTISYTDIDYFVTTGEFISHPGNVNGVDDANPTDVADLAGAMFDSGLLPWDLSSSDLDRSGMFAPLDILAGIDLLNGAEAYKVWNGTPLPIPGRDCP